MIYLDWNGRKHKVSWLAEKHGLKTSTLRKRLRKGIPLDRALTPEHLNSKGVREKERAERGALFDTMLKQVLMAYVIEHTLDKVQEHVARLFKEIKGDNGRPDNAS